jgi:hypothetical protein
VAVVQLRSYVHLFLLAGGLVCETDFCIEQAHYDDQDAQVLQIFSSTPDEIEMTQNGNDDDDDDDDDCAVQG